MSKNFYGSIDLTQLLEAARALHPAFKRAGEKNHVYVNVSVWLNDEPDKFGNVLSIKALPPADSQAERFYIGNCKPGKIQPQELNPDDFGSDDDLPF